MLVDGKIDPRTPRGRSQRPERGRGFARDANISLSESDSLIFDPTIASVYAV